MNRFKTTKVIAPIERVRANEWNPNKQDDFIWKKEMQSIQEFGFIGSITVREKEGLFEGSPTVYEIIDGEHRWKACRELGYTEIPVETVGILSDNEAKALLMLMNMRGKDDLEKQAKLFKSMSENQLSLLPFTTEEINNVISLFNFDFSKYERHTDEEESDQTRMLFKMSYVQFDIIKEALDTTNLKETDALLAIIKTYMEVVGLNKLKR